MHKTHYYIISLISLVLLIIGAIGLTISGLLPVEDRRVYSLTPSDGLHVSGTKVVDGSGNTILLRGAQVEMLNRNMPNPDWNNFSKTVSVMKNTWHMNVVRLPTCAWRWQASPTSYMN